jgi:DNA polymerase I
MILDVLINQVGGRTKLYGTKVGGEKVLLNEDHFPYFYSLEPKEGKMIQDCTQSRMRKLSNGEEIDLYKISTYYSGSVTRVSTDVDFENHILYHNRFIIDDGIQQDDIEPKVLTFDIECLAQDEFSFPISSKDPIMSIALKCGDVKEVIMNENEEELLLQFIDIVQDCDPDLICGYNSNGFDIKYIMDRCEVHNLIDPFARIGNTYNRERVDSQTGKKTVRWYFPGRVNFDVIIPVFADQSLNAKTKGRGLKAVGKYFYRKGDIDYEPIELEESFRSLWFGGEEGRNKLKEYNMRDVDCTHDICMKIYLPAIMELAKILECDLQAACYYTQYWLSEIVMGKKYREENVLCDVANEDRFANIFQLISKGTGKVQGALTGIKKRGFFWNPFKIDFKGYYPSIVRKFNISPENCELVKTMEYSESGFKEWENDTHKFFCIPDSNCKVTFVIKIDQTKRGYLPQVEDVFNDTRNMVIKEGGKGSNSRNWAIKVLMNALIGVQALPYTTKGSILCSILVLGIARENTRRALEIAEKVGGNICNWDTDGLIVSDYYDIDKLMEETIKSTGLPLEHEATYEYTLIYKPKCYVINYKGDKIIHGIALKGKDKPNLVDKLMDELIDLLVKYNEDENIVNHVMRFLLDIDFLDQDRFEPSDYMINKTLQKEVEDYIANTPQKRVAEEMLRRGSNMSAGDELTYFWGLYADENKNTIREEVYIAKDGKPRKRKIKMDCMPMLSEDWKLVSFELTDLNNTIETLSKSHRMKGRWMSFYKEISPYLKQKDYAELAQEIGDQEWSATYYYYNKMYEQMNMLKRFKLRKNKKPPADFFTEFYDYLSDYYPSEDEFSKFFEDLCGVSTIDVENIDLIDDEVATMEMHKQDIIGELDERYQLDWFSDKYNVDALTIAVSKYAKLAADVLSRILSAYFGLIEAGKKDIKLNEMGRRIKDLFMRKDKIRGTTLPVDEFVKRKLVLWKERHGVEPEQDVEGVQSKLEV